MPRKNAGIGPIPPHTDASTRCSPTNDVRLLPYLAQLIIRSVPYVKGSVILLGSTGRRCGGSLAFEARD